MNTDKYWNSLADKKKNKKKNWIESQSRCLKLKKGKAFSVLSFGETSFKIFKYLLLNIISIYKMHVTILYTVIRFLQT